MDNVEINKNKAELEFEKSLEIRNFEIDKFWLRGFIFGALLVAIGGAYFELFKDKDLNRYCLYFSFLAFLISFAQCLMNRGSKYWQERWEYHAKHKESALGIDVTKMENNFPDNKEYSEMELIEAYILSKDDNFYTRSKRYSVSKLTFLVWDIITIFCLSVWIKDSNILHNWYITKTPVHYVSRPFANIFHFVVLGYILLFFFLKKNWWKEYWSKSLPKKIPSKYSVRTHPNKIKLRKLWLYLCRKFPFSNGGGGQVYSKLGENLKPEPRNAKGSQTIGGKTKRGKKAKTISRKELHEIYEAGGNGSTI